MNDSKRSSCPRSTPGTEISGLEDCFLDPFIVVFRLRSGCVQIVVWFRPRRSEFEEFPGGRGQNFTAARRDQGIVFNSNSPNAFDVYTGFQGHHVAGRETRLLVPSDPGILMNLKADAVARAMNKIPTKSLALQDVSGRGVDRTAGHAGLQRVAGRRLRLQHRLVPLADARGGLPHENRARQVTAVAAQYSTQVEDDQLVFPNLARGWTRMRQR